MNRIKEINEALEELRRNMVVSYTWNARQVENDLFDWTADAIAEWISEVPEEVWHDGFGYPEDMSVYFVVKHELHYRLGEQLPGMVAEMMESAKFRRRAAFELRVARAMLARIPI